MSATELLKAEKWLTVWNICIVVGAAITAIATFFSIRYSDKVQFLKDQELSSFQTGAQRDIAHANARAAEANAHAKSAEEHLAGANERASQAYERAAKAEKEAAKFNETAERERMARLQIEARLAPRVLTPAQQQSIVDKLRPLGGQRIDFFMYPNNGEIINIAEQVKASLEGAGWNVVGFQPMGGGRVMGMHIEFDPVDIVGRHRAETLTVALRECGLQISGPIPTLPTPPEHMPAYLGPTGMKPEATIRLTIGTK